VSQELGEFLQGEEFSDAQNMFDVVAFLDEDEGQSPGPTLHTKEVLPATSRSRLPSGSSALRQSAASPQYPVNPRPVRTNALMRRDHLSFLQMRELLALSAALAQSAVPDNKRRRAEEASSPSSQPKRTRRCTPSAAKSRAAQQRQRVDGRFVKEGGARKTDERWVSAS
jgi:hypothetical protein